MLSEGKVGAGGGGGAGTVGAGHAVGAGAHVLEADRARKGRGQPVRMAQRELLDQGAALVHVARPEMPAQKELLDQKAALGAPTATWSGWGMVVTV